ncbi:hypothetical protein G5I_13663 [Acromyrmex echinatior]|uniref:Uncharacterized protein n=1 Tax=Acromyrmex echinatior TaxID=103372 RepID=F4X5M5_ACREC|nr:hypothetical protein G5I_13663 [Acromyrmex echinatior]
MHYSLGEENEEDRFGRRKLGGTSLFFRQPRRCRCHFRFLETVPRTERLEDENCVRYSQPKCTTSQLHHQTNNKKDIRSRDCARETRDREKKRRREKKSTICNRLPHLLLLLYQELKATNESLKSLQTQLELAYASTASSGHPVGGISGLAGASVIGLGSVSGGAGAGGCDGGTVLGGSVAVPGGVPGSTTLTAIMETKDARITTLEKEVALLEAELQRIKECGGRLREQLLKAIAVPNSGGTIQQQQQLGITQPTGLGGQQQPGTLPLARGPSMMTSLVPYGGHASSAALTSSLLAGSTGGPTTGSGGGFGVGGGSSCLAGISSGTTTGVTEFSTKSNSAGIIQIVEYMERWRERLVGNRTFSYIVDADDVWKSVEEARDKRETCREDSGFRTEKVNEKVVCFDSFYYDAVKKTMRTPKILIGLRS